jgi:hypothetical protein
MNTGRNNRVTVIPLQQNRGSLYDILSSRNHVQQIPVHQNINRLQRNDTHEDNIEYLKDYNNRIEHTLIVPENVSNYYRNYNDDIFDVFTFTGPISNFLSIFDTVFQDDVKMPLTRSAYMSLKVDDYKNIKTESKIDNCSICLEKYVDTDKLKILPCKHFFHIQCIEPWLLSQSYKCPLCRAECGQHTHM